MVLVAAAAVAALMFPLPPVKEIRNYLGTTGWRGPAAFILAYAALTLAPVPVPKSVLSVAAGLVFGFAGGIAVVFPAAILGSVAPFWLGRESVEKFTGARVEKVDQLLRLRPEPREVRSGR